MQPISEFKDRLFISAGAKSERIAEFSCDHIVPPENILPIALLNGPTGHSLDFSYGSRNANVTVKINCILCGKRLVHYFYFLAK